MADPFSIEHIKGDQFSIKWLCELLDINIFLLGMFSLPRKNDAFEAINQGRKSYILGRNLPEVPFCQYSTDGLIKKEFLPYKSSGPDE